MADFEVTYQIENEEQFWDEVNEVVSTECPAGAHESIDNALRTWLALACRCRDEFDGTEEDIATCSQKLLQADLFAANRSYVRTQIIYSLLQEEETIALYVIATFLLLDGRQNEDTFRFMVDEGCFHRLMELINGKNQDDPTLHRLLLELMYEMSRIERLRKDDLLGVDDGFVSYLFQLIEGVSDDVHDPYHYPVIRVLLVLNEQYMVASTSENNAPDKPSPPLTNRVIKCLSLYGDHYRTFGENIILLLNRETETSLQLLILKLLYLLFTYKGTFEYFYTNDLRVLLDVIIRNLLDLPNELMSLRHTYLRVLYPLLSHTQLSQPPHYKREEILKVLRLLSGAGNMHFAPTDDTTMRLVNRVARVEWLCNGESKKSPTGLGAGEIARRLLGISLDSSQATSKLSVVDVAAVMEKPGVQTPSKKAEFEAELKDTDLNPSHPEPQTVAEAVQQIGEESAAQPIEGMELQETKAKKQRPEVPKHRHGLFLARSSKPASSIQNGMEDSKGKVEPPAKKLPPKTPPPRRTAKKNDGTPPPLVPALPAATT